MISIIPGEMDDPALPILLEAFRRSVTPGLISVLDQESGTGCTVFLSPREDQVSLLREALTAGSKVLVFGRLGPAVANVCGLKHVGPISSAWREAAACSPAPRHGTSASLATIAWSNAGLAGKSAYRSRPFLRFDFANEWNNLGYGRVTADGSAWSIATAAQLDRAVPLAQAQIPGVETLPFVTLLDSTDSSLLWWNRAVGPVDSGEWAVVEAFLTDWRVEDLISVPVVEEVPFGYDVAVTMRLDCDENIASAQPLFELYRARGIPFSVAVRTAQEGQQRDIDLLVEIKSSGGAILSHSVTHAPNWGGSEAACVAEARSSSDWLEARVPGLKITNAVSPFHQNPPYVPPALGRAGLAGFVGGIVANDPEALLARGGTLPADTSGVVTHSQQCMLHGDCMIAHGDPLGIPKAAFRSARQSRTFFGYLDHPFSPRYDYGWGSEEARLRAHSDFLEFIANETAEHAVLWMNEDETLRWIKRKSLLQINFDDRGFAIGGLTSENPPFGVRWRGRTVPLMALIDG